MTSKFRSQLFHQYEFLRNEIRDTFPTVKDRCTEPGALLTGSFIGLLKKFDYFFTEQFIVQHIPDQDLEYIKNNLDGILQSIASLEEVGERVHPEPSIARCVNFFDHICSVAKRVAVVCTDYPD